MTETRTPLKDKPLRSPGQSIRRQRIDLVLGRLLIPLVFAVMFSAYAYAEWERYLFPRQGIPWISSVLALGATAYFLFLYRRTDKLLEPLQLAADGEKTVGQFLEGLREKEYQVYHDILSDGFNVDHVLIGPAGIFTVETKTWSKPAKGKSEIHFDGETLTAGGRKPDRNPVIQAKAQTSWLHRLLAESTGKPLPVRPVILFPGWFIVDSRQNRRDLWVLELKALPAWLENEKVQLAPEDINLASFHLARYVRSQERLADKAS